MSTALYRRYRPETFADVIGQEHVTEPLMQALRSGRVNHAYLFSGPRGCGKTTSARILARCLNCENGPTPDPCGTCESCRALARGGPGAVDVIEIDAASHGGVDDARDLRERAAFGPAQARYKVYIIDEAHMVTPHGFNALLKVVEEPPEHVKFIFATTEPEKVLSTIRSRTHHYPFHLVPPQRLTGYLEELCAQEGVNLEPGVLSFVTRAGAGSVRDSLSVLDQLMAGAGAEGLTYERTAALLGFTDLELLDAVVDAVAAGDAASVFTQVDKVMESGHDPRRFVEDLLERYRDLIVLAAVGDRSGGLMRGLPEDQIERMSQQAARYSPQTLSRAADIVSRGLSEMTGAVSYRMHLELICARLLLPAADGEQGYAVRLDRIERRLSAGGPSSSSPAAAPAPAQRSERPQPGPDQPESDHSEPDQPESSQSESDHGEQRQPEPSHTEQQREAEQQRHTEQRESVSEAPTAEGGAPPPEREAPVAPGPQERPDTAREPEQTASAQPPAASTDADGAGEVGALDTDAIRRAWPQILDAVKKIRRVTWTFVSAATVIEFDGRRLVLGIGTEGQTNTFRQGNHADVVSQGLNSALGIQAQVEGVPIDGGGPGPGRGSQPGSSGGGWGGPPAADHAGPSRREPRDATTERGAVSQQSGPRGHDGPTMAEQLGVAGGRPSRHSAPDWGSGAAAAPPSWATDTAEPPPAEPVGGEPGSAPEGDPAAGPAVAHESSRGGQPSERSSARQSAEAANKPTDPVPPQPDDPVRSGRPNLRVIPGGDLPSADDEDLESSGLVGQPVVENVLGGTVISIDEDGKQ